ncbi:MAG: hypothetical protein E7665_08940 [Ruminococcaceae bacterium]|nr:hypothetical protein [Oscillospiraceae bacterium]
MTLFYSTLEQMEFLFFLIIVGFIIVKAGILPDSTAKLLSKMESYIFIPALVMGTFNENCTAQKLTSSLSFIYAGSITIVISIIIAFTFGRFFSKDKYLRKIYTYGLAYSNYGFMGNAVVSALFPDLFMDYLLFTLPFSLLVYALIIPALLMPKQEKESPDNKNILSVIFTKLKSVMNPMLIGMFIGMILGLTELPRPAFFDTAVSTLGSCMSPIAMLLTGMTVAKIDLKKTFKTIPIYILSFIRLIVIPLIAIGVIFAFSKLFSPISNELSICILASLAMPLGLNTVVIPGSWGGDTTDAAGMALISHLLSCITIPFIFLVFDILL